jgi:DNA-binding response OmpR family regulator
MSAHALLVEDNIGDVELFTSAFDELNTGMNLKVAFHNGNIPDVLAETSENNPEGLPKIIFLDVNLPGFSGLDILEKIRASHHMRFIPVVVLTSSGNPKDVSRAYNLGASGYIIKPMDFDNLRDKVHATLDFWLKTCTIPS